MPEPFHPLIVHMPIALTFILPFLIFIFAKLIHDNKMTPYGWLIVIVLQMVVTATGYISLESGETEEHKVEKIVSKKLIHEHEEASEIFVGSSVVALVISIAAFFIRKEFQFRIKLAVGVISLISAYLAYDTGRLGGELVYKHGAASAYAEAQAEPETSAQGILPTPGLNTSESVMPVEENESLKTDENDYRSSDEFAQPEEEALKLED
ncbi:MAG TPA: DUF2231 domain-containing protein [Bacteriovoracaceae bacterium]|nr:DUF2231 domain-containing protein [Bacteriovoracaceae bacterium]